MSAFQRSKGQRGELTVARLIHEHTGWDVKRKVRQHGLDSDLEGVPGFAVEVKDHAVATLGNVRLWWSQAAKQADIAGLIPALFYKRQRGEWRAVWPVAVGLHVQRADMWRDYEWTVEGSIAAWAAVAREVHHG